MATRATSRGPVPADRRRVAPKPGADSATAPAWQGPTLPSNQPLRPVDVARMAALTKQEAQWAAVTSFLPRIQQLYQLTALPAGVVHEEIIRGTPTDSGKYKAGEGNLEKALRSLP